MLNSNKNKILFPNNINNNDEDQDESLNWLVNFSKGSKNFKKLDNNNYNKIISAVPKSNIKINENESYNKFPENFKKKSLSVLDIEENEERLSQLLNSNESDDSSDNNEDDSESIENEEILSNTINNNNTENSKLSKTTTETNNNIKNDKRLLEFKMSNTERNAVNAATWFEDILNIVDITIKKKKILDDEEVAIVNLLNLEKTFIKNWQERLIELSKIALEDVIMNEINNNPKSLFTISKEDCLNKVAKMINPMNITTIKDDNKDKKIKPISVKLNEFKNKRINFNDGNNNSENDNKISVNQL
jgi:hypothetical protein